MNIKKTKINGAFLIESQITQDDRGFFLKAFDALKFEEVDLESKIVQLNLSQSQQKGTIRGLHYQTKPALETKIMRCIKGSIFYSIVDLRPDSPTYKQWEGFTLSEKNRNMVYIPSLCATGYQALEDNSQALYSSSNIYSPESESGIRFNDPLFKIKWPLFPTVISDKDKKWENYKIC